MGREHAYDPAFNGRELSRPDDLGEGILTGIVHLSCRIGMAIGDAATIWSRAAKTQQGRQIANKYAEDA
jgi:hypothetical protein